LDDGKDAFENKEILTMQSEVNCSLFLTRDNNKFSINYIPNYSDITFSFDRNFVIRPIIFPMHEVHMDDRLEWLRENYNLTYFGDKTEKEIFETKKMK
jgi:hypothetical protein